MDAPTDTTVTTSTPAMPASIEGVPDLFVDEDFGNDSPEVQSLAKHSKNTVATEKRRLQLPNIFWLTLAHALAVVALFHFTWEALALCLGLLFLVTPFGVNLGYHRLLTHKSLKVPQWLEYILVTIGSACGGGPPLHWVAEHRLHHRFSDQDMDPHDAKRGFWYAHVGHLFWHKDFEDMEEQWIKYVPDYSTNRYYRWLNKYWIAVAVAAAAPLYFWGGLSYLLWGGFVRVVLMLHITWFVNSASHMWGYRNYQSRDAARNCWWVGLLAAGEGWHNNHHAYPTSAAHGHKWWEFDFTYGIVRVLKFLGLAQDVKLAKPLMK